MNAVPEQKKAEEKPAPRSKGLITDFAADLIAVGSSIIAGAVTAWSQVQRHAYRNMSALDSFEDMKPKRKIEREKIYKELKEGLITPEKSLEKIDQLIEKNERDSFKRMEEFGINSMKDRWNILRRHQKLEVISWAMVASGVAIGSLLQFKPTLTGKEEPETQEKETPKR